MADLVESAYEKVFGTSAVDQQVATALERMSADGVSLDVKLHSQGALIGANALRHLAARGMSLPEGSKVTMFGPAVSQRSALGAFLAVGGSADHFVWNAHPHDPVPGLSFSAGVTGWFKGVRNMAVYGIAPHSSYFH